MSWSHSQILIKIISNNKTIKIKFLMTSLISHKTKIGCQRNLVLESTELMTNSKILETQKKIIIGTNFIMPIIKIWITMPTNKWPLVGSLLKHKLLAQIVILCLGCHLLIPNTSREGVMGIHLKRPLSFSGQN